MDNKKQVVILQHNGGRLANQLWLFIHVYGYCLDKKIKFEYPAFYEYAQYFPQIKLPKYCRVFQIISNTIHPHRLILYAIYVLLTRVFIIKSTDQILNAHHKTISLPPSSLKSNSKAINEILVLNRDSRLILLGWNFQNPIGIAKFHDEICSFLKPRNDILSRVDIFLKNLKSEFTHIVGVHIRQGDYKRFMNGIYYIDQNSISNQLDKFYSRYERNKLCFVICSDGEIDEELFEKHHYVLGIGDTISDLFLLAGCDEIIGSHSTFGSFAGYYGKIPYAIFNAN